MGKFGGFQINFDKPTYFKLKEISIGRGVSKTDLVFIAVHMALAIIADKSLLSESGTAKWQEIVRSFRSATDLRTRSE